MGHVLRWGRSAYETDADLGLERAVADGLGWTWASHPDVASVPNGLEACDVLVTTSKVRVDGDVLARLRGSWVVTTTSGVDHIDRAACAARGVQVVRCPQARRDAVVSYAIGALIGLMRCVDDQVGAAKLGRWARNELTGLAPRGLDGAVVVVVGFGVIGRAMAEALHTFGATVRVVDPFVEVPAPLASRLDEALVGADAVSLHCALTPSSRGLMGTRQLAVLPPHAVVVNTARGDVLDVNTAIGAVRAGRLRGLACDVFPQEPFAHMAQAEHPRIWLTPHSAGFTHDLGARVARDVADAMTAIAEGRVPTYVVPPGAPV